ncbi:MAG: hypothetical protein GY864_13260 [Desulfobacterales bacterium]|nr:hypothetical protein [Desulfobacterales bacterium]
MEDLPLCHINGCVPHRPGTGGVEGKGTFFQREHQLHLIHDGINGIIVAKGQTGHERDHPMEDQERQDEDDRI